MTRRHWMMLLGLLAATAYALLMVHWVWPWLAKWGVL